MSHHIAKAASISRRSLLRQMGALGLSVASGAAWGEDLVDLPIVSGPRERPLTRAFAQKGTMILQRTRPPLLETPMAVFDRGVFTPNDQFYVRWHWADIPTTIDVGAFRLSVRGHVNQPLSLALHELLDSLPQVELAAVNQCSGNSRGYFQPRVPGAQWSHGAMGNAKWTGVRLRDLLDRAGVKAGAIQVRFSGLDEPVVPEAPDFKKSLNIDHARDGEVMIAYAMNGEQLPLLNGFPLRLIVPGWYSTYWVKMLSDIEVLDTPDHNYWMAVAYTIPDTPHASIMPGQTGVKLVPINRMPPRSFLTNLPEDARIPAGLKSLARGIAIGGDIGVAKVEFSPDGGKSWRLARLGEDHCKYSFRQWNADFTLAEKGSHDLMVRCTNFRGEVQPDQPNWNNGGFMRNVVEAVRVIAT